MNAIAVKCILYNFVLINLIGLGETIETVAIAVAGKSETIEEKEEEKRKLSRNERHFKI